MTESRCPLVMIEWEDSRQPSSSWRRLADLTNGGAVRCVSVGWLLQDGKVKVLAPNMGDVEAGEAMQVSGVVEIPERCVVKVSKLKEPKITSSSCP